MTGDQEVGVTGRTHHHPPRSWAAGELVRGLRVAAPLPEGAAPTAALLLVRCDTGESGADGAGGSRGEDGGGWILRATEGVGDEELLGALTARVEQLKARLLARYAAEAGRGPAV